jgi:hypothetical protein
VNLWARASAIAAAVVVAALLLKVAHPALVLAVLVGGLAFAYSVARRARGSDRLVGGEVLGLRPDPNGTLGILGSPLALFGRTADAAVENPLSGRWRSTEVQAFELTFRPPSIPGDAPRAASFACAMSRLAASYPGIVVEPQAFLTLLEGAPPGAVVATGDAAFDAQTTVWSDDAEFAGTLLDAEGRGWMRSLDGAWGIELRGGHAVVYGPGSKPYDPIASLDVLRDLLDRLPGDLPAPSV